MVMRQSLKIPGIEGSTLNENLIEKYLQIGNGLGIVW